MAGGNVPPPLPSAVIVRSEDVRFAATRCAGALGTFAVFLALRAMVGDPAAPWWSVTVVTCLGLLTTATAAWLAAPGYLYGAGLLSNLAATLWYAVEGHSLGGGNGVLGLLEVNAAALASPGSRGWCWTGSGSKQCEPPAGPGPGRRPSTALPRRHPRCW